MRIANRLFNCFVNSCSQKRNLNVYDPCFLKTSIGTIGTPAKIKNILCSEVA